MTEIAYKTMETEQYLLKLYDNAFMEYIVKEGVTIDEKMILESKKKIEESHPGVKFYVLAQGLGFFNVTAGARNLSATLPFSSHMSAVAFYTSSDLLKLLGGLYNSINKPAIPTKVFNTREEAITWLQSMREADAGSTSE